MFLQVAPVRSALLLGRRTVEHCICRLLLALVAPDTPLAPPAGKKKNPVGKFSRSARGGHGPKGDNADSL